MKDVLALFPAGTILRDLQHGESPTHREQDLDVRRTWVQAFLIHKVDIGKPLDYNKLVSILKKFYADKIDEGKVTSLLKQYN